ncbi:MAG: hypothetical protein ABJE95_12940 [Byssovorax sp.]
MSDSTAKLLGIGRCFEPFYWLDERTKFSFEPFYDIVNLMCDSGIANQEPFVGSARPLHDVGRRLPLNTCDNDLITYLE